MFTTLSRVTSVLLTCTTPFECVEPHLNDPALIVLSGTQTARDLIVDDLDIRTAHWPPNSIDGGVVHRGFARRTRTLCDSMSSFLNKHESFVVAGHSLGGACAVLMASLLAQREKDIQAVYTFGMPRLASPKFREFYIEQGLVEVSRHFATPLDPVVHNIPYVYKAMGEYEVIPCDKKDSWDQHDMRAYYEYFQPASFEMPS